MNRLEGKVAIITGTSHGIGKVMANVFADEGASVVLSDIERYTNEETGEILKPNMSFLKTDLRDEEAIKLLIDFTINRYKKLDIVVNNARPKLNWLPFEESMDDWDLAMDVLLKAPALVSKYALPHLVESKGSIVNISSTNAFTISPQPASYHVAKAGLNHLTRYLAYEYGSKGVRVNTVCPGLVELYDKDKTSLMSKPLNKKLVETIVPLKRAASAEDIAEAVIFLSSDYSSFITGEILTVDGGAMLGDAFHNAHQVYKMATQ